MENGDVIPDDSLLEQIFGDDRPETTSIFLQNWDKCVFKAEFPQDFENCNSPRVVRL
jgi:hypothetical protein